MNPRISVIVPAYKKEKTIERDLQAIKTVVDKIKFPTELICVVDGYIDKTFENASRFAKNFNNVRVVGYEHNKGKGYAVRFGMAESKGEVVAFIDAGMDLNPEGLIILLDLFDWNKADIVVGSKRHPLSKVNYPWQRKVLSFFYQRLVKVLFGIGVSDTQVGMKVYKRQVLEKVLPRLLVKTYAFDIEILAVSKYLGFGKIFEGPVEITLDFGGTSDLTSKGFLINVFNMLKDTLAVFYRLRILKYYSNSSDRKWIHNPELNMKVNIEYGITPWGDKVDER